MKLRFFIFQHSHPHHHSLLLIHRSNFHSNEYFFSPPFRLHTLASYVFSAASDPEKNNNNSEMHFKYFMNKRRNLIIFYCKNCNQNLNHTHTHRHTNAIRARRKRWDCVQCNTLCALGTHTHANAYCSIEQQ